jgi:hypothetical protein
LDAIGANLLACRVQVWTCSQDASELGSGGAIACQHKKLPESKSLPLSNEDVFNYVDLELLTLSWFSTSAACGFK